MRKQRKNKAARKARPSRPGPSEQFHTPFADLALMLKESRGEAQPDDIEAQEHGREGSPAPAGKASVHADESNVFQEAMVGVEPISSKRLRPRPPGPLLKPSRRPLIEEELEVYAQLVDLVSGEGRFDIQHTDEYVEGGVVGIDPRLLRKLRRGDFSTQAHLDLHGMTAEEARVAIERFVRLSVAQGLRCVLIIHGRGLNSRDQIPILKERMASWLKRGQLKRLVLAFATARVCDGGAGALYLLLRKRLPAGG